MTSKGLSKDSTVSIGLAIVIALALLYNERTNNERDQRLIRIELAQIQASKDFQRVTEELHRESKNRSSDRWRRSEMKMWVEASKAHGTKLADIPEVQNED